MAKKRWNIQQDERGSYALTSDLGKIYFDKTYGPPGNYTLWLGGHIVATLLGSKNTVVGLEELSRRQPRRQPRERRSLTESLF